MNEVENLILCLNDAIQTARRRAFDAGFSAGATVEPSGDHKKVYTKAWTQFLDDENNRPRLAKF
jgi:hypothetical protein